jgi:hypothetical protein
MSAACDSCSIECRMRTCSRSAAVGRSLLPASRSWRTTRSSALLACTRCRGALKRTQRSSASSVPMCSSGDVSSDGSADSRSSIESANSMLACADSSRCTCAFASSAGALAPSASFASSASEPAISNSVVESACGSRRSTSSTNGAMAPIGRWCIAMCATSSVALERPLATPPPCHWLTEPCSSESRNAGGAAAAGSVAARSSATNCDALRPSASSERSALAGQRASSASTACSAWCVARSRSTRTTLERTLLTSTNSLCAASVAGASPVRKNDDRYVGAPGAASCVLSSSSSRPPARCCVASGALLSLLAARRRAVLLRARRRAAAAAAAASTPMTSGHSRAM